MIPNELDFILVNLCTKGTPSHIYRTKNHDAVEILYYTLDFQLLMEKKLFAPIYYHENDIQRLCLAESILFQKALKNTAIMLPGNIIELATYLKESETATSGQAERLLIQSISNNLFSLPEEEKVWCLTNPMCYGGALGCYQYPVLKDFCDIRGFSKIYIGVGNRDYAYVLKETKINQEHVHYLLEEVPDFMENNGVLEYTYLFIYDNQTNTLTRIS